MRQSFKKLARTAYELLDRTGIVSGNPWRYIPCKESILVRELLSPLRLDILVRLEFLEFCAENLDLYANDFARFYQLVCQQPYYLWYKYVNCARFAPRCLENEKEFRRRFENRIRAAVELYTAVQREGFETKRPIILHSGKKIKSTATGKWTSKTVFAGDGCHRIAMLLSQGIEFLEPEYCKIRYYREFSPLDHTSLLVQRMSLSRREYFAFLSLGYSSRVFTTEEDLLAYVRRERTGQVSELENIISIDNAIFEQRDHEQNSDQRRSSEFSVLKHLHGLSGSPAPTRIAD